MSVLARTAAHVLETRAVEASTGPLSSSKVQVLRLLANRGRHTSSQVARFLNVSRPSVTQIIDALAKAGLVTRRSAADDRREVVLALTKRGRQAFRAVRREQRHLLRSAIRAAGGGEVDEWITVLQKISGSLARADSAFTHFCLQCSAHADGSCVLVGGDADCHFLRHSAPSAKRSRRGAASKKVAPHG
ncbi:MAG: MarR family transcriptional regulator [Phycisphaerales bacterium]|nr:MarR family transcriptional regulator [Phycisphaerales bacterium]